MRKLAREAVIFMLFGMLVSALTVFCYLLHDRITAIHIQVKGLRKACDSMPSWAAGTMVSIAAPIEGQEFENHSREECNDVLGSTWKKQHPVTPIPPPPSGWIVDSSPKFNPSTSEPLSFSPRIDLSINSMEILTASLICGAYGFAGGGGLWLFYRLVRFAVRG
jgi:hypothetical protein